MYFDNLIWLFRRFARMSNVERLHRVRESSVKRKLRRHPGLEALPKAFIDVLDLSVFLSKADAQYCAKQWAVTNIGAQAFGRTWPTDNDGNLRWQSFLNGIDSSATWCFEVTYRESLDIVDDVRLAWEINRLTFLLPVAAHASVSHDGEAVAYVTNTVRNFLATDRVGYGLRWNSMIELSMQSMSLVVLDSFMHSDPEWQHVRGDLATALRQRYRWLEMLPSLYSSSNNHRLAELAALSVMAQVL